MNTFDFLIGTNDSYIVITDPPATDDGSPPDVYGNATVKWIVRFEAYPTPLVIWSRGKDAAVIKKNPIKYKITTETRQTVLEITNVELADSGVYRLVISNGNETQQQTRNLNFTLLVRGKVEVEIYFCCEINPFLLSCKKYLIKI